MKLVKYENNDSNAIQNLPYEKFISYGAETLTDAELLAVILRTGTPHMNAQALGAEVLKAAGKYGNGLLGLHHIPLQELMKVNGIGKVKAVKLKALAEICTRMAQTRARGNLSFREPYSVADYYMERFRHEKVEHILLLLLDSGLHLLEEKILSTGTANASLLSPREVYISAFRSQAAYIMLLHNHPGGNPAPSGNDISITERIAQIGKTIDISLIDHIIIGDNSYFSFKESKLIG
ncbi:MAG: DNA repair protein RadC [Clostridium sp.]|nr:DNA repair protein RadC [Clostridium sp.]MCM1388265.1 DNA repair protein RadC [Bacillus sp. (in: firmicutes)]MCM1427685.1 DNA repair protein RadC [Eubacterium sp.]